MASEVPPKVDDEIDAFAENAFDTLMLDENKRQAEQAYEDVEIDEVMMDDVVMVSDSPPSGAQTAANDAEVVQLQSEVAELRDKLAAAGSGAVSSREFLDLREALNTKDKEILQLRDDVTAREKEVLEMREQNLIFERQKADLDDNIVGLNASLKKAEERAVSLEKDKDTASKRYEDVKMRFERADDRVRQLEDEVAQEKQLRSDEVSALTSEKETEIQRLVAKHEEDLVTTKAEAASQREAMREDQDAALAAAASDKDGALAALRSELSDAHSAALTQAESQAEAEKQAALAALRQDLEEATAAQLSEAAANHTKMLGEREAELQAERQLEVESLEEDHSKQLATLGRKLSDTETELAGVRERERLSGERVEELEAQSAGLESRLGLLDTELQDTQRLHHDVQAELSGTRESRDRLQTELDGALGDVETAQRNNKDLTSRVGSLEAIQGQLESRLQTAMEKIATDDALLERVRKAMAIGLGLLEEQRGNALSDDDIQELDDDVNIEVIEDAE